VNASEPCHPVVSVNQHPTEKENRLEAADLLVRYLEALGVEYVFGVPGGAIEPLFNALARSERRGGPRVVVARHETGAAFMADGYARQTGKPGVCCATTGPGATNLITGVSAAYENHTPLLVITAQTALTHFGRGAFQESSCTGVNTVGMFQYCTRYNTLVSHIDQFEHKLVAAIMATHQPEAGPAHLSIPLDLLRQPVPMSGPAYDLATLLCQPSLLDGDAVATLCQQIESAKKVVFVIGEGCCESISILLELAAMINAVVITTPHGKGLINPYHPLFRGVVGFAGHSTAREALLDPGVDMVVATGTSLGEWASNGWDSATLLNKRLVHVDSAAWNLTRSPMARLHVRGRIRSIFEQVIEYVRKCRPQDIQQPMASLQSSLASTPHHTRGESVRHFRLNEETRYNDDAVPIKPQRLMHELTRLFPPSTCFLADTGNSVAWAIHYLHPCDRRLAGKRGASAGLFRSCLEFSAMGWAIGAAVGTALGCQDSPVVCLTGDGSLLMSGQELSVAVQERLPVIFIILNDSALGMVKHGQRLAHAEPVGFKLPDIDYSAYAGAMGVEGHIIHSVQDLEDLDIDTMCMRKGPTLLDVRIDPEEVPPIGARIKVLGEAT